MATWFTYEYCTDIDATRKFYGDLVGLEQIWDSPETLLPARLRAIVLHAGGYLAAIPRLGISARLEA